MKCKDCAYWKENENIKEKGFGECDCPKFIYDTSYEWKENKEIKNDCLLYMDYEWYSAGVETGENFGCIHFKVKEK